MAVSLGSFWDDFGVILALPRHHVGVIWESFWDHFAAIWCHFLMHSVICQFFNHSSGLFVDLRKPFRGLYGTANCIRVQSRHGHIYYPIC